MNDNELCPLCCEELDMSDRQFFPCKCGYQVCMWCWHRIRESESGLCPACRTPYGDDPHEFSAVDMEEVVKANKEKAAAEKRERERLRQQQQQLQGGSVGGSVSGSGVISSASSVGSSSSGYFSSGAGLGHIQSSGLMLEGDLSGNAHGASSTGISGSNGKSLDPPKDRNQLANMRVIRRNLVYAVGLPPPTATEDALRRSEYFGQYGKITKIVLNRNHNGNGDPRRASASAYVTFAHKEDALACILALDGFYLDGRNIRASYGTSKYCSAFIKNVRCNNPDCTYLHYMGDGEDTFAKQEIQAGYVTSGRDVLAKQQQQMASQQQSGTRRRVGGGGPSGTGKASASPVFPPPCYDEPTKPERSVNSSATFSVSSGVTRSVSAGFSSVTAGGSSSVGSSSSTGIGSAKLTRSLSASSSTPSAAEKLSKQQEQLRRLHPQNKPSTSSTISKKTAGSNSINESASLGPGTSSGTTAASVVAGGGNSTSSTCSHSIPSFQSTHTPLTSLTPLKRSSSTSSSNSKDKPSLAGKNNGIVSKSIPGIISNNSQSNAPSIRSSNDINNVQLPPNLPVPQGLTPSAQAALLEQRRESLAAAAKQQEERLLAMRKNGNNKSLTPGFISNDINVESNNFIGGSVLVGGISSKGSSGAVIGSNNKGVTSGLSPTDCNNSTVLGSNFGGVGLSLPGISVGKDGFSSSLSLGSGGSSRLNQGGDDINNGSSTNNGSRLIGGKNSNFYNLNGPTQRQQNLQISSFSGQERWIENESSLSSTYSGGSLFGNSPYLGRGGIWGNDGQNVVGSGQTALTSTSLNQKPYSYSSFPPGSSSIGANRSTGLHEQSNKDKIGRQAIGGGNILGNNPFAGETGSSTLASMLGINLPTGSGSLRESNLSIGSNTLGPTNNRNSTSFTSLRSGHFPGHGATNHESLWDKSQKQIPEGSNFHNAGNYRSRTNSTSSQGAIGSSPNRNDMSNGVVGGMTIGGGAGPVGGYRSHLNSNGSESSDIALLQSLLPGVHITSGNAHQPAAPMSSMSTGPVGWNASNGGPTINQNNVIGRHVSSSNDKLNSGNYNENADTWGSVSSLYGGNANVQQQNMSTRSSIW